MLLSCQQQWCDKDLSLPSCSRLWVAAVHEGSGLTLAPGSAGLIAGQLLGLDAEGLSAAFLPADKPHWQACTSLCRRGV